MNKIINKNKENVNKVVEEVQKTFNKPKRNTDRTAAKFNHEHKESKKLYECSQSLFTTILQHQQNKDIKKNLSFFACKSKFCSICNQIKSKKWSKETFKTITNLQKEKEQKFLFLTLTIQNVKIEELDATIKKMNKAWRDLWRYHFDKEMRFHGFIKVLEITFPNGDMSHPHFHILLSVNKNYFYKSNKEYLTTERISELWGQVLKVDYLPIVDIKTIKPKKKHGKIVKQAVPAVIAEMLKYPMKDTDYNKLNEDTMALLYSNLFRKRLIATGGNLKMSINKVEDSGELNEVEDLEEWKKIAYIVMKFHGGSYVVAGGDFF